MKVHKTILIVEDEATSMEAMAAYFEIENYRVIGAGDGKEMRAALARHLVDLIVLDLRLPGEDGLTLLRELRSHSDIPVIVVSSRTDEIDHIVALEIGADDYLDKPVNLRELLVRTHNILRRCAPRSAIHRGDGPPRIAFDNWILDADARSLTTPSGADVHLTRAEFDLLHHLASRAGTVLSREQLLDGMSARSWSPNDRTIDVLIRRLRSKIETNPRSPRLILTVHGIGYTFRREGPRAVPGTRGKRSTRKPASARSKTAEAI